MFSGNDVARQSPPMTHPVQSDGACIRSPGIKRPRPPVTLRTSSSIPAEAAKCSFRSLANNLCYRGALCATGRSHDVPVTGHNAVCVVQCEGFSGSNWTAVCLKSRIHRSGLLINFCRVNAVPSPPLGEKVADRPDERLSLKAAC